MNHFYLITNEGKDKDFSMTNHVREYLITHGKKCTVRSQEKHTEGSFTDASLIPADVDCIIVLGGDGTLLQAARDVLKLQLPLLGINLGTLGYLAEIDADKTDRALERLLAEEYETEPRMMIDGCIQKQNQPETTDFALNDIVISRCGMLKIIYYDIFVNGQFLKGYSADGIIISTPTGSTGYNMSAGGPIVEPKAALMLLTPICPHTLNTRSIILAPEDVIEIVIADGRDGSVQQVQVSFDGSHNIMLETGDKIRITRCNQDTKILKLSKLSFLEVLHRKMNDV